MSIAIEKIGSTKLKRIVQFIDARNFQPAVTQGFEGEFGRNEVENNHE
ncbi:hypothetical protein [Nitrosomonas sp.]